MDKKEFIQSLCSLESIPTNEFIDRDEAYRKVMNANRLGASEEAGFYLNLDQIEEMMAAIKAHNLFPGSRKVAGLRVWKGVQKIGSNNECAEDLVLVPVDEQGVDLHYYGDLPKTIDGQKELMLAACRPCPHLCGSGSEL